MGYGLTIHGVGRFLGVFAVGIVSGSTLLAGVFFKEGSWNCGFYVARFCMSSPSDPPLSSTLEYFMCKGVHFHPVWVWVHSPWVSWDHLVFLEGGLLGIGGAIMNGLNRETRLGVLSGLQFFTLGSGSVSLLLISFFSAKSWPASEMLPVSHF